MYLTFISKFQLERNCNVSKILQNSFPVENLHNWFFFRKLKISLFHSCVLQNYDENFMQTWGQQNVALDTKSEKESLFCMYKPTFMATFNVFHSNTSNTIILQNTSNTILVDVFLVWRLSKFDVLTRNRLMYSGFGICIRAVFQRSSRYSNSLAW